MELIDRQALRERLGIAEDCKDCEHNGMETFCGNMMHFYYACEAIDEMPTIDAVPVIRCHKCIHWMQNTVRQNSNDAGWWNEALCEEHSRYGNEPFEAWTPADWFCADGEREES